MTRRVSIAEDSERDVICCEHLIQALPKTTSECPQSGPLITLQSNEWYGMILYSIQSGWNRDISSLMT